MKRTFLPQNFTVEKRMIHSLAWSFHNTTGVDIEELTSEALLAYCEARLTYKQSMKTKFTSHAYKCMRSRLINFIKIEKRYLIADLEHELEEITVYPGLFFELMDEFPEDCIYIAEQVLNSDKIETCTGVSNLLREHGWTWPRIWRSLKEMKQTLKKIPENCIIY